MSTEYSNAFYLKLREGARASAREVIPWVLELTQPKSVIDIGCGTGTWLSVFREFGIPETMGVDGDYVSRELLEIPAEFFVASDLTMPFHLDKQFDLVVSLEVAEHLPAQSAEEFVASLTRLGPVILFSAAIPYQNILGGVGHVNEQWPDYWANFFQQRGFVAIDAIRPRIWQNPQVERWYAQNTLLFARDDYLSLNPKLRKELKNSGMAHLSVVHPNFFGIVCREYQNVRRQYEDSVQDADKSRAKAKAYFAEAESWKAEAQSCNAEAQSWKAKAQFFEEKSKPQNMPLRQVLKAFPAIIAGGVRRTIGR